MTDTELIEARKEVRAFAEEHRTAADTLGRFNLELTRDYLKEQSYKLSTHYITLNVGILSVSAFIFSGRQLIAPAKYFALLLLGSIFAIVIEVLIRKRMLKILDEDAWARMGLADEHAKNIGLILQKYFLTNLIECSEEILKLAQGLWPKQKAQHEITNRKLAPIMRWRFIAEILSLFSLVALFLISLFQLGLKISITM